MQFFSKSTLILILVSSVFGCKKAQPEVYLIHHGFKGKVNVIFNQENGSAPKYDNNRRVYEIPTSGILLTQFNDEYGLVNREYYYVDSLGNRIALKVLKDDFFVNNNSVNRKEVGVFHDGTTGVYGNSSDPKALRYQEFIISDFNTLDSFFRPEYKNEFKDRIKENIGHDF